MLREFRFFFKNAIVKYSVAGAKLFTVAQVIILIVKIKPAREPIFLHYTSYLGVDFVGMWYLMFLTPFASLLFTVVNITLAFRIRGKDQLLPFFLQIGKALIFAFFLSMLS